MTVTSSAPGAISVFYSYMQTVAEANPAMNLEVFFGKPTQNVTAQYLQIGRYTDGILAAPDAETDWESFPAAAKRRSEKYSLYGCIRTWAGQVDQQGRLNDCFALYDALYEEILSDPRGSGTLTGSGAWGPLTWTVEQFGPIAAGWGCVLGLELHVVNAITVG